MKLISKTLCKLLVGLSTGFVAVAASANVITLYGDWTAPPPGSQITYTDNDDRGTLTCSVGCTALLSNLASGVYDANVPNVSTADGFSALTGDLFWLGSNSLASETAFVNAVVEPDFVTGTKIDGGGADSITFTTSAAYILLKIGANPDVALIYNPTGLEQTYTWSGFAREGAGLSHYTMFGETAFQVPEPGSLGLMGVGLLGVAVLTRRRKVGR